MLRSTKDRWIQRLKPDHVWTLGEIRSYTKMLNQASRKDNPEYTRVVQDLEAQFTGNYNITK